MLVGPAPGSSVPARSSSSPRNGGAGFCKSSRVGDQVGGTVYTGIVYRLVCSGSCVIRSECYLPPPSQCH